MSSKNKKFTQRPRSTSIALSARSAPRRSLTTDEIAAINTYVVFDRYGKPKGVKLNRLGAPTGYAHVPVEVSVHIDRKGREYRVIHTEILDLKAEVYKEKQRRRRADEMRMAA